MSIFDVFTFKKEAEKIFTADNFKAVMEKAREEIIKQIKLAIANGIINKLVNLVSFLKKLEIYSSGFLFLCCIAWPSSWEIITIADKEFELHVPLLIIKVLDFVL